MSNKTILFADDSVTMRTIMEKTFFAEPFDVVTVPSGEAAIAKVKEIEPDVVIVDAGMVGVSGYDVCKAVREMSHLSDTPLVVLSGVSKQYNEALGRSVGVDEHIKKPFDTAQMIEKITTLASRPRLAAAGGIGSPSEPADALELVTEEHADHLSTLDAPLDLMEEGAIDGDNEAEVVIEDGSGGDEDAVILTEEDEVIVESVDEPVVEVDGPSKKTQTLPRPSQPRDLPKPRPIQMQPSHKPKISIASDEAAIGEEQPIAVQEPEPVVGVEPEVEPIELTDIGERADSGSFQVGTLAELAQMDHKGKPLEMESRPDAIEFPAASSKGEPVLGAPELDEPGLDEPGSDEPVLGVSSAADKATVQAKVDHAVSRISTAVQGVTAEQAQAIESLTRNVIEQVVWEVVPDLAETIIKEEIARLLKE